MQLENSGFTDPLSGEKITIDRTETYLVTGDVRDDGSSYKYLINLANQIDWTKIKGNKHQGERQKCICQFFQKKYSRSRHHNMYYE